MDREKAIDTVKLYWPIDEGGPVLREAIECLIPEFKESEDERIKREMISWLKSFIGEEEGCGYTDEEIRERIAWLEKQGEQKSAWSEEDEIGFRDAMWAIEQARTIAKNENDMGNLWYAEKWLKSLKERYAWKPTEKQLQVLDSVYKTHGLSAENKHIFLELLNKLKSL